MSTPFYGWTIVGVGMVVSCVGFGAMISLTVFLAPIAEATSPRCRARAG